MASLTSVNFDPFAAPALVRTAPSTESQRELWTASQLESDASLAFNEAVYLTLEGPLDWTAFERAFAAVVQAHEALHTAFSKDGTSLLVEDIEPELPFEDLSEKSEAERQARIQAIRDDQVGTPFDLARSPLFRARMVRLTSDKHQFYFVAHHIACDGWSMAVILGDLAETYTKLVQGQPLPQLERPKFTDYAAAEQAKANADGLRDSERYWLSRFQSTVLPLDLPLDRTRPRLKSYASDRIDVTLAPELLTPLRTLGAKNGASLFAVLLSAFSVLMSRLGSTDDVVVGIPAAGQSQSGDTALVGHCVNMLPVRTRVQSTSTFLEHLKGVQSGVLDAYEHQDLTFGRLLQKLALPRDPSRLPLMSTSFNVDQAISVDTIAFQGLVVQFASTPRAFENFEIFVNAVRGANSMVLEVQYNTDLFDRATVERWFENYENLLRGILSNPASTVSELPLLTPTELARCASWNDSTKLDYPRTERFGTLLIERAREAGDRATIHATDGTLSYCSVSERASALAALLQAKGVGPGSLVGISLTRTSRLLVAVLGVLRAGGAYVPLDPSFPRDRLAFMVEDAGLSLIISESNLADEIAAPGVERWLFDESALEGNGGAPSDEQATAEDPAYVIYTSGSTGKPKGVAVPRRAAANFLTSMALTPGLTANDCLLAVTTLSFDISVLELLLPVWVGGSIVLATSSQAADGAALATLLVDHRVSVMQATPATWRLLLATEAKGLQGLKALCGGEALSRALASELLAAGVELWNMYGPTETTVWSTCHHVKSADTKISIGRPIANTQIYILDSQLRPAPLGVVGELCIAGDGVTLGYLNRPELTSAVFLPNPFGAGKLYRTGDLARFSPDGTIECLGRSDGQVKVRGYRIELGEIDSVLGRHESVKHCVTMVREDRPGDQRLVAYVVPAGTFPDSEQFRAFLKLSLPEYMVPQHFVDMAAFPLTPNGKVDKKRLPAPFSVQSDENLFEEPSTENERVVQKVWQKVLGLPRVSASDDFFRLGGHSLLAAQVVAQVVRELGIEVSMRRVFDSPSLKSFAKVLDTAQSKGQSTELAIPRRPREASARLSPMQQRVWFMEEMNPGTTIYNLGGGFRMHGELNEAALEQALNEMARRHTTIRTTFGWHDGELRQFIKSDFAFDLRPVDLRDLSPSERESRFRAALAEDVYQHFDLATGPLVQLRLYRMTERENVLTFSAHHAIWDGWSFDIFLDELDRLYTTYSRGEPPNLPQLEVTYGDYAEWFPQWMAGPELEKQMKFWKGQFTGDAPVLELPTDRPRPANMTFDGGGHSFKLSAELADRLTEVGQRYGVTLFMVLIGAFEVLLHRLTGQSDIVIGTPMRSRSRPELEPLIGYFVNPLPLRFRVEGSAQFSKLLEHTKSVCVSGFEHQDLPFDMLVNELNLERDTSRTPLYSTFFTFQDARNRRASFGDLSYDVLGVDAPVCPTDLNLWAKRLEDSVVGALEYATDLFSADTTKQWLDEYLTLLNSIADTPELQVAELPMATAAELSQFARLEASVIAAYPQDSLLIDLIETQVRTTPDATAVRFGSTALSYLQVNERANQIAHCLRDLGVGVGSTVGICLERCADLVIAALSVQKCGAAYVPLDPAFPTERLKFMVEDAALKWIVIHEATREDYPRVETTATLDLDTSSDKIAAASTSNPARPPVDPAELAAYMIYTSGSTGKPKGVIVPQKALVNFVLSMAKAPGIDATDRLLAVTTLSFDIAVLELYVPLIVGAQVVIASRETALDGDLLDEAIDDFDITVMQATPSTWRLLLSAGFTGKERFKVLCGGEAFPLELAQKLLPVASEVWNMYGPTETTVWSTCQKLAAPVESIRIGTPIANTTVYVVDPQGNRVPFGSVGELWLGGDGVALGYHNRPDLTSEKFIKNPFGSGRVYKTGDLVRFRPPGELEYLRRNDNQVKLRGYRIELGDIEAALTQLDGVKQAVAVLREDSPGDTRLVAYVTTETQGSTVPDAELRAGLRLIVPEYMVPQTFVTLEAYPLTPNGKVDRKALPKPEAADLAKSSNYLAPRTEDEKLVAEIWQEVLRTSNVGVKDNFFDIGGHSLLCLQMTNRLEQATGVRLNPRVILRNNLEQVATILAEGKTLVLSPETTKSGPGIPAASPGGAKGFAQRLLGRIKGH